MDHKIQALILKKIKGNMSDDEEAQINSWLKEHETYRKKFQEITAVWEETGKINFDEDFSTHDEWELFLTHLQKTEGPIIFEESLPVEKRRRYVSPFWIWSFIGLVILAFIIYFFIGYRPIPPQRIVEIVTSEGERAQHKFSDGTKVWLNENTSLSFPENFLNDSRRVNIIGEAFFEVAPERKRPFYVHSGNAVAQVIGTSFNIKTSQDLDSVQVVVVIGSVSLYSDLDPGEEVLLRSGMAGYYFRLTNTIHVIENPDQNLLAWHNKKLVFNDMPIREVIAALNENFDVEIKIATLEIINCRFTNTFYDASLEDILDELSRTFGLEFRQQGDVYYIIGKGC